MEVLKEDNVKEDNVKTNNMYLIMYLKYFWK